MKWRPLLLLGGLVVVGCRAGERRARLEKLRVEQQQMMDSLDDLEARLLTDAARVRFWKEMRERHEQVSAIACQNLQGHVAQMDRYQEEQREKRAERARKSRVASTFVPASASE